MIGFINKQHKQYKIMGTRHNQRVISKSGEVKISQYGQWDGYPDGQGTNILEYLKTADLEKYQQNLESIKPINEEQSKEVQKTINWDAIYPYLSRDCGSKIHQMIEDGTVNFVVLQDIEDANKWCEGFYTIDFKKNTFTTEFYGKKKYYKLDKLPTEKKYLKDFQDKKD